MCMYKYSTDFVIKVCTVTYERRHQPRRLNVFVYITQIFRTTHSESLSSGLVIPRYICIKVRRYPISED